MISGAYGFEYSFDIGDLGWHGGYVRGNVQQTEHGHVIPEITAAYVHIPNQPIIDVLPLLTKAARVDIEERLVARFDVDMASRRAFA
jgi:hypothetical protein